MIKPPTRTERHLYIAWYSRDAQGRTTGSPAEYLVLYTPIALFSTRIGDPPDGLNRLDGVNVRLIQDNIYT
jgi:hypothetical protein